MVHQIGKGSIEVEYLIDLPKDKIVQGLIIELEHQFVLDLQIEEGHQIDLECQLELLVDQTVPIAVLEFHLVFANQSLLVS